jgi:6-phosphogluconolactonase
MSERRARRVVTQDPAGALAERIAGAVRAGGHIALAGGDTPRPAYERLAEMNLPWEGCTLWFGDERCVPPDDDRSNYGMARSALLGRLEHSRPRVERIEGECGPHEAADRYERALAAEFGSGMPAFDLVLLGLGSDGHCASLFPGSPALEEHERPVAAIELAPTEPRVPRVTLTLPAISAASAVVFAVAGAAKAAVAARAIAGDPTLPAGHVTSRAGAPTFFLDPAAAAGLEP